LAVESGIAPSQLLLEEEAMLETMLQVVKWRSKQQHAKR
jgi:hypothetical protein